jgi:hypothetical protein
VPGHGIRIYPSPAAVDARIRPRSVLRPDHPVPFGLPSLDEVLGNDAIAQGDVIVLHGVGASFKSPLGMIFLMHADDKAPPMRSVPLCTPQNGGKPRRFAYTLQPFMALSRPIQWVFLGRTLSTIGLGVEYKHAYIDSEPQTVRRQTNHAFACVP